MISIIVFSKDRPLQLEGYLTSLMHYTGVKQDYIKILYTCSPNISYDKLIKKYSKIDWVKEACYSTDLKKLILGSENFVMFGCDDVFFTESMNINHALETLQKDLSIFSFHLRLGMNIEGCPKINNHSNYIKWDWKSTTSMHWNYPWEVSAAIYRKTDVLELLSQMDFSLCKSPNYFEDLIFKNIKEGVIPIQNNLASFYKSKAVTLTINRVQDDYKNPFDQTATTSVVELYSFFQNNLFLNWKKFENKLNTYIHVDSMYFSLSNEDPINFKKHTPIFVEDNGSSKKQPLKIGLSLKLLILKNKIYRKTVRLINIINPNILLRIRKIRKKLKKGNSL